MCVCYLSIDYNQFKCVCKSCYLFENSTDDVCYLSTDYSQIKCVCKSCYLFENSTDDVCYLSIDYNQFKCVCKSCYLFENSTDDVCYLSTDYSQIKCVCKSCYLRILLTMRAHAFVSGTSTSATCCLLISDPNTASPPTTLSQTSSTMESQAVGRERSADTFYTRFHFTPSISCNMFKKFRILFKILNELICDTFTYCTALYTVFFNYFCIR